MRAVLSSSPGPGPGAHRSHAEAGAVAAALVAAGCEVLWFPVVGARDEVPAPLPGLAGFSPVVWWRPPLRRVGANASDPLSERQLAAELRAHPAAVVVQCGVGAGGSPNLLWLAERMGCPAFAIARAAEVLCARGDLVHATGAACVVADDAERCRRCMSPSWWGRPAAAEFPNRRELLLADLQACRVVFVPAADDAARLEAAGVPRRLLQVTDPAGAPAALAAAVASVRV